jgi:hypothetical protein
MTDIKTKDALVDELRRFLRMYLRSIDTGDNSLVKDLVLLPYSIGGQGIMDQVAIARDLKILSRITGSDLDTYATDYKLERLTGSYATVQLTFYSLQIPTADIIIPAQAQSTTQGSLFVSQMTYSTISEARYSLASVASYYSFDRDRYEFTVTAICDSIGGLGNVASEYITKLSSTISGIDGVTNLVAATGGSNSEIDDDFRIRIQAAILGRDLNTVNGLKSYARSLGFIDAYPIRIESPDVERATGIDVFVINTSAEVKVDTIVYDPSQEIYYLSKRPVLAVSSVVGSITGTLDSSQYSINIDSTSSLRRSIYAQDYIRIPNGSGIPYGEIITIAYTYAPLIVNAQSTLDNNDNDVLTADVLLKRAYPISLYLNANLTLKANADGPSTRNTVRNALTSWIADYHLGDDIQKSDLIVICQQGYGEFPVYTVDAVILNSYYGLDEFGNAYNPVNEIVSINDKQYVVLGTTTIL